jgi:integrase
MRKRGSERVLGPYEPDSIRQTIWAIEQFFPQSVALVALTPKKCQALYDELRVRPLERTKKPPSADTHRSMLAQSKTFLEWCRARGWMRFVNPLEDVEGVGKRRPRGKSLGRRNHQLRIKEARAWFTKAIQLADDGDEGAIAALVALLLGMRASEIVSRRVGDLDDDERPGDVLWIEDAKTEAGRRTLEVPEVLRPFLVECAEGKTSERYLFECERPHEYGLGKPHGRDWVLDQVHRVCQLAGVPEMTAHGMRGLLATLSSERGIAGHAVAAMLGHEDQRTTFGAYAAPGSASAGDRRRGLVVLNGGVQVRPKSAK